MLQMAVDPSEYFAERLYKSMKGELDSDESLEYVEGHKCLSRSDITCAG